MTSAHMQRGMAAELLGTCLLVTVVVGSGIMAKSLTADAALALLVNSIATGTGLYVLITLFSPISGAHLNPLVSLVAWMNGQLTVRQLEIYIAAQICGGLLGAVLAHAMFSMPLLTQSATERTGWGQWLGEGVAAFGLLFTILAGQRATPSSIPSLVGAYITSAYWFTYSTSFANPAVTLARTFTDTFTGIRMIDVPAFILAQVVGGLAALWLTRWLLADTTQLRDRT